MTTSTAPALSLLWDRAAYLHEARDGAALSSTGSTDATRVDEWKAAGFLDDAMLSRKLDGLGLDRTAFARLISARPSFEYCDESAECEVYWERPDAGAPGWQQILWAILQEWDRRMESADAELFASGDFVGTLRPFVNGAWSRLRALMPALPAGLTIDLDAVGAQVRRVLALRLLRVCQRTLVLELNVARLDERLRGATPDERYHDYVDRLLAAPGEWRRIFSEYQVLGRLIGEYILRWLESTAELLQRLAADWEALGRRILQTQSEMRLVAVTGGLSDEHRGARTVWILSLAPGIDDATPPLRIVYKPKSLALDAHFNALLHWCNDQFERDSTVPPASADVPPFRLLRLIDRVDYGWMECVARADCASREEAARFYRRQGAFLALLYFLRGTDMHSENLIACGEHPMLIDLETLLQPRIELPPDTSATGAAQRLIGESALRVGLLPQWSWGEGRDQGVNVAGLGNGGPQMTPYEIPTWEDMGTDLMHVVRKKRPMPESENLPGIGGVTAAVTDYVDDLIVGFESTCRMFMRNRAALLAPEGLLQGFASDPVRFVARATAQYSKLIEDGYHPDNLRDAFHRDQLCDVLWTFSRGSALHERLIGSEQEDLRAGDVPYFSTSPRGRDVLDSHGRSLPDIFPTSSLELCHAWLQQLDEACLQQQLWIIRASLASISTSRHVASTAAESDNSRPAAASAVPLHCSADELLRDALLSQAVQIGETLMISAIQGEDDAVWLGLNHAGEERWSLGPVGYDLYDGTAGIAVFLAWLGDLTADDRATALARRALRGVLRRIDEEGGANLGGFSGLSSALYALSLLGSLWEDESIVHEIGRRLDRVESAVSVDRVYDIIAGSAGTIGAMLAVHSVTGLEAALRIALACGRKLDADATVTVQGSGWRGVDTARPLLGFSHGTAGVAWALQHLAEAVRRHSDGEGARSAVGFEERAGAALKYERSHYDPVRRNWPDFRDFAAAGLLPPGGAQPFMSAWCHGAPGIVLARATAPARFRDHSAQLEIRIGVETTFRTGMGINHSLCHGDLGNLLAIESAVALGESEDWPDRVRAGTWRVLDEIRDRGPRCGVPLGHFTPGLMTGLAGIGYGLLSLCSPDRLPNLLALQPWHRGEGR
ncbi:MAG: type 2 lantipeptide synthetase LanM [Acidobacteria bacterium]|nr:type 2 lantipeptide synthetase LanM [Acidobacteriota bacterium]